MEFVEVDGSEGEGGGQILRTAVAFSAILHRPVRVDRIRGGRVVPGLKRQHVSALRILASIFGGSLTGATEGSSVVTFAPGEGQAASLSIDMGTAASITLVLQAVVPAVALTGSGLRLDLVGGTDVPWSPTYDYFERVVRDAYRSVGIVFDLTATRRGYYPRGGGRVTIQVEPCVSLSPLGGPDPSPLSEVALLSRCGSLPKHVAERQLSSAEGLLRESGFKVARSEATVESSSSPGSSLLAYHVGPGVFVGADGIGAKGKTAEEVGGDAARRFVLEARSGAQLDSNLADMLIPLLSLAHGPSNVSVPAITPHLKSGMRLAEKFTGCGWSARESNGNYLVRVDPSPR